MRVAERWDTNFRRKFADTAARPCCDQIAEMTPKYRTGLIVGILAVAAYVVVYTLVIS